MSTADPGVRRLIVLALGIGMSVSAATARAATVPQAPPAGGAAGRVAMRPVPRAPGGIARPGVPRGGPVGGAVRPPVPGGAAGAIGSRTTSIQGAAWQADSGPVQKAVLRLRNVVTGEIQATTVATDAGNFAFNAIPDGTYLIEVIAESGKVMMVGQAITVAPGETVATFVRLGPKVPFFNGFFGNAAQSVSSAAASTGVTAVAPETVTPISSQK